MTTLAERTIAALRAEYDELAKIASTLSPEQLTGPSGADEWTVAQVFSHLGSGAEITLAGFRAGTGAAEAPGPDFNQSVWDRWNAMSPQDQLAGWLAGDAELIAAFEGLTPDQHATLKLKTFLPDPVPVALFAGLRLNESSLHSWDIRVAVDPAAGLGAETAELLAELYAGDLSFLLGFIGKLDALSVPAVVDVDGSPYSLVLDGQARVATGAAEPTATFTGPLEAALRLIAGRLTPAHTAAGTTVTGNVTLDDLRRVFPGY
jgi:uncharacterized protein (TIGR03083 family)